MGKFKKFFWLGLAGVVILIAVSAFVMFGPPKMLARSSQPDFCAGCHVMEAQYDAWAHVGAHRNIKCVDCHLPNQNATVHYIWKSIDGLKDAVLFYSGQVSDDIELTGHGRKVLQANCIRCHETTVSMIDDTRDCWKCHRGVQHQTSGTIQTL
ncbi:cytochrome c nitrite reductase small subunit [Trichloromonas sp.]|uniref:cytochrome c nitrite reductase small subunit n=1 Tax=Trichloromonas sp. TaxID=3069249 RepID=UPI002A4D2F18|nr:cytochrome c nitrite reductase small subunit [Trichloromonas sp.]